MASTLKYQVLPSFGRQIVPWIGTLSPIFQPYRAARSRPTSAPCRSASKALSWSGGTLNSGYIDRYGSGSTAMTANWLALSRYVPPNQVLWDTTFTPGVDWMSRMYEIGR